MVKHKSRLKEIRQGIGLTIDQVVEATGISKRTIITIANEEGANPKCTFRINGAPFPRQRCKRLALAVRYPFVVTC